MKKLLKVLLIITSILVFVGCSGEGTSKSTTKSTDKGAVAALEVKNGTYISLDGSDDKNYLELDVKVKNNSKSKFYIMEDSFYLIEKGDDEKINAMRMTTMDIDAISLYDKGINGDLSPETSLSGKVIFEIEENKEYTLYFSSQSFDEDSQLHKDVSVPLDLKKIADTKDKLDEPLKAFEAYVDVVLLNKENKNFEKLIANDPKTDKEKLKNEFIKKAKNYYFESNTDEEQMNKAFASYVKELSTKYVNENKLLYSISDTASVSSKISSINNQSLRSAIRTAKDEYSDTVSDYSSDKENLFVLNNFEKILAKQKSGYLLDVEITLVKKDDKWEVALDSDKYYGNKKLVNSFLGDSY